jgi:hypothetical protein
VGVEIGTRRNERHAEGLVCTVPGVLCLATSVVSDVLQVSETFKGFRISTTRVINRTWGIALEPQEQI